MFSSSDLACYSMEYDLLRHVAPMAMDLCVFWLSYAVVAGVLRQASRRSCISLLVQSLAQKLSDVCEFRRQEQSHSRLEGCRRRGRLQWKSSGN